MRIALVIIIIAGGIALFLGGRSSDETTPVAASESTPATADAEASTTSSVPEVEALPMLDEPPEVLRSIHAPLVEVDGWLQSDIDELEDLRGQVVIVEFWTFGCFNCKNRIPYTQDIYATYKGEGLEIVGIHSPEFAYEEEVDNINNALVDLGVTWPIVLDTDRLTFRMWQGGGTAYWPRTYVLDQNGQVRFDHIGEGGYEELEATVAYLLANPPDPIAES